MWRVGRDGRQQTPTPGTSLRYLRYLLSYWTYLPPALLMTCWSLLAELLDRGYRLQCHQRLYTMDFTAGTVACVDSKPPSNDEVMRYKPRYKPRCPHIRVKPTTSKLLHFLKHSIWRNSCLRSTAQTCATLVFLSLLSQPQLLLGVVVIRMVIRMIIRMIIGMTIRRIFSKMPMTDGTLYPYLFKESANS